MSTLIEDPHIPLLEMNGRNKFYSVFGGRVSSISTTGNGANSGACKKPFKNGKPHPYHFGTVGNMLATRKELFLRRKRYCDVSLCLALVGVGIMIIETELHTAFLIDRSSLLSFLMKTCITAFTVSLLIFLAIYHYFDIQLFAVDNGVEDLRLAMSARRVVKIALEFIICGIHPIPGAFTVSWSATVADGQIARKMIIPLDVMLSVPMFLRCYLICRAIMLHSRLYQDASSQGLGALNRINFNFSFIFKSLMTLYPEYVLSVIMSGAFLTSSWMLRLCEMYGEDGGKDDVHASFLNCMWLVAVSFLSIGYGDIVPSSFCGRGIAVLSGMMGAGCTALVVAVLSRKIELSRSEKYVHDFVIDADLDKQLKQNAADVMRAGWFVYKHKKIKVDKSKERTHQRKLLQAVSNIREIRSAQRRLLDNSVTLVEVGKSHNLTACSLHVIRQRQVMMEEKVNEIQSQVAQVLQQVSIMASANVGQYKPHHSN